jgi:peptidoglycan/xylan/chitin deacetylase (PgdA/CDA1 family)
MKSVSQFLRRPCKVLTYHRILPEELLTGEVTQRSLIVTTETFRRQLLFLKSKYDILTMDGYVNILQRGADFRKPCCVIAFDDGWRDNYLYALPILKELSAPAIIFVATEHVDSGKEFWPERLTRILLNLRYDRKESLEMLDSSLPISFRPDKRITRNEKMDLANHAIINLKDRPLEKTLSAISRLEESVWVRRDWDQNERKICSWAELKNMTGTGLITIGSHTKSHTILTNETEETCESEIFDSKKTVEQNLGLAVNHFSYPNGNFNSTIERMVVAAGYESASTCLNGVNHSTTSPYRIRRIHVTDPRSTDQKDFSTSRFALEISDGWQKLKRLRNSIGGRPY